MTPPQKLWTLLFPQLWLISFFHGGFDFVEDPETQNRFSAVIGHSLPTMESLSSF